VAERPFPTLVEPRPAASVMVFRSAPAGPVVLYLRRNTGWRFTAATGSFQVDESTPEIEERTGRLTTRRRPDARRCAKRMRKPVKDLHVALLEFAVHWTTPRTSPIRFSTWFFIAETTSDVVQIDGQEIHDHRWMRPVDTLRAQAAGTIRLAGPTFALTTRLAGYPDVPSVFNAVRQWTDERLLGRLCDVTGGGVALYEQDIAYHDSGRALGRSGPRHRLWMVDDGWRYERDF